MARIKLFSFTQVADLESQINDASTGLSTKVDQLESNPVYTLIKEYDSSVTYPIGFPIKRDGKLYVCNTANTTGAFAASKWTVLGRANTDDVIVESGTDKITIKVESGVPTFEMTDGSTVTKAEFRIDNGRIRLTGATTIEDAGDNDVLVKSDVQTTSDRYTFDGTKKRLKQTDAATEVASDDNDVLVKSDVPFTKTEVTYDTTAKRVSVVEDAVTTASDDKHILTKKDFDALNVPQTYLGSFYSTSNSDTWAIVIETPDLKIEARSPASGNRIALITNKMDDTINYSWQASRDNFTEVRGDYVSAKDGQFEIVGSDTSDGKRFIRIAAQNNTVGTYKEQKTFWIDIISHRVGVSGCRVYVKMLVN